MHFNGIHSIETILGLVGASLVLKAVEKCTEKYCQSEEVHQIIQEVEQEVKEELNHEEIYNEVESTKTLTPRSENSTVYNLAVQPTKLLNK
jgi:divalent metal cation (Fe/Co/Zn/Cd) transporter